MVLHFTHNITKILMCIILILTNLVTDKIFNAQKR